jgi:hypothetical protein
MGSYLTRARENAKEKQVLLYASIGALTLFTYMMYRKYKYARVEICNQINISCKLMRDLNLQFCRE